ncbi:hypothetical protein IKO50_02105 [bacterium]|nr:hypothetical protein [bacterium]
MLITLAPLPLKAQFALKGGVSFAEKELSNYVVTGQFYKDLLVLSGDLNIPAQKYEKISGGGRIGIGFGSYRFRIAGDIGATYGADKWKCGCGVEGNLRLYGPIGVFGRWSRMFTIDKRCDHKEILWEKGCTEFSVGVTIDLINGRHY